MMDLEKLTDEELSIKYKLSDTILQNKILKEVWRRCQYDSILAVISKASPAKTDENTNEMLQDALMEAYTRLISNQLRTTKEEPITNLKGWLIRVSRNYFLSKLPKGKYMPLENAEKIIIEDESSHDTWQAEALLVYVILAFIDEEYYDIFVAYHVEHKKKLTYQQLADKLQCDKRKIQTALEVSLRNLRKTLESVRELELPCLSQPKYDLKAIFELILDYTDRSFDLPIEARPVLRALLLLLNSTEREVAIAYFFEQKKQSQIVEIYAKKRIQLGLDFWNTLQKKLGQMIDSIKYIHALSQIQ